MDDVKKFAKAFNQPTLKATPRSNSVVGFFADALKPVQQFASNYNIPQSIPLIGGQSVADITGLTGAQGLLEDVSYGAPVVRGGSFQTAQVDPRVLDVAGLVPTGVGVAKGAGMYGKSLAKEIGRNINEGTAIGNLLDPRMMVIKEVGKGQIPDNIREKIIKGKEGWPISEYLNGPMLKENMSATIMKLQDGDYVSSYLPRWGREGKDFYAVGNDVDELAKYTADRAKRSEKATSASKDKAFKNSTLGKLINEFGDVFSEASSTQSKSKYITHIPSGTKIRISDHDLPLNYEQPDLNFNLNDNPEYILNEFKKYISTGN